MKKPKIGVDQYGMEREGERKRVIFGEPECALTKYGRRGSPKIMAVLRCLVKRFFFPHIVRRLMNSTTSANYR